MHDAFGSGMSAKLATNDLDAFWMPFTANRQFKKAPRLLVSAEGMYFTAADGRRVLDGTSGLWCVNAGHCRPKIVEAVRKQVGELDFAGNFQMGHPRAFECAAKLVNIAPPGFDHVFFTNSGSESVETALKIALAYHRARGKATKTRLIGRERGYHGVNFGGTSVGGILNNRKMFGTLLGGVDHVRHTHDLSRNAFSRGEPTHGAELADDLGRQAIEFAIAHKLDFVEAGAQGAHKLARGYLPVETYSAHYIADPALRRAVADYLARERLAVSHEIAILAGESPYRSKDRL
jgi:beta-alanine--pyruvate transaminase